MNKRFSEKSKKMNKFRSWKNNSNKTDIKNFKESLHNKQEKEMTKINLKTTQINQNPHPLILQTKRTADHVLLAQSTFYIIHNFYSISLSKKC